MKGKKRILLILVLLLVCLLAAGTLLFGVRVVRSMYTSLSKKVDYTNNLMYAIDENVSNIRYTLNAEYAHFSFDDSWTKQTPPLIAHAFGGIDGETYTNSLEAFQANYAAGHRVFEVDLDLTQPECTLIASHDRHTWLQKTGQDDAAAYSYAGFKSTPILSRYTPLDCHDILRLMAEYPDIYIVTDSKYMDRATVFLQFSQLVRCAQEIDESVLQRVIPQIYCEDMLRWIMEIYPFRSVIYTVYATTSTMQEVYSFCEQSGIRIVTVPVSSLSAYSTLPWDTLGVTLATHTVNTPEEMQRCLKAGASILYTDFLTPDDL